MAHRLIDLTRPLNRQTPIYADGAYRDPPLEVADWCGPPDQPFRVSRLALGTQTGTHIDAPAHFLPGGPTLDALGADALMGRCFLIRAHDLADTASCSRALAGFGDEPILFVMGTFPPIEVPGDVLERLLGLGRRVWVLMGELVVAGREPFRFNRALAEAGVYLIEDLDDRRADEVAPGGEVIALPLRLEGVSGSPCRVVMRYSD